MDGKDVTVLHEQGGRSQVTPLDFYVCQKYLHCALQPTTTFTYNHFLSLQQADGLSSKKIGSQGEEQGKVDVSGGENWRKL